jgi:hypothetical protein
MRVLLIGPSDEPLFAEIVASVHAAEGVSQIDAAASLVELDRALKPDLILVLQRWPDEYPRQQILTLIDAYPLARLLVCYGPWCDSDGRTRDLWPHVVRVPLATAASRLSHELERLRKGASHLPLTADRTEAYLPLAAPQNSPLTKPLSIAVFSLDRALTDHLRDVLRTAGHSPVTADSDSPDVLLWDADPWTPSARMQLERLRATHPEVPCVALYGFLRRELTHELHSAGVVAVVPKLADNLTLVSCLEQAARHV